MARRILGKQIKWQAPGNSKIFNSNFSDKESENTIIRDRSFWTLRYIKEYKPNTKDVKKGLIPYLKRNINNFKENNSYLIHFIKPLIFFGLVDELKTDKFTNKYILTTNGRIFLNYYDNNKISDSIYFFVLALLNVNFANNKAVSRTNTPHLFPFRIIFYLINKYGNLSADDFKEWIPFIKNKSDLMKENFIRKQEYPKFHTWVINGLRDIGIFLKKNNFYTLPDDILKMAKDSELILDEDLLFDNTASIYTSQHFARRVEFTEEIKNKAKENFDFLCSIDKNDKLFHINKYGKNQNFLHVHHIIPASMQKTFKNLDLGSIDNALPICPYCHELLHHAVPEEKIKVIDSIFKLKEKYMNELSIDRYELLDIYQNL